MKQSDATLESTTPNSDAPRGGSSRSRMLERRSFGHSYLRHTPRPGGVEGTGNGSTPDRVLGEEIREENMRLSASHQPHIDVGDEGLFFIDDNPDLWTSLVANQQGF